MASINTYMYQLYHFTRIKNNFRSKISVNTDLSYFCRLENHLRTYQTLTVNDVIGVEYDNFAYEFDVIELKPQHAVSILDSDVTVDILEPLEMQKIIHTEMKFEETKQIKLTKGQSAYFQGILTISYFGKKIIFDGLFSVWSKGYLPLSSINFDLFS